MLLLSLSYSDISVCWYYADEESAVGKLGPLWLMQRIHVNILVQLPEADYKSAISNTLSEGLTHFPHYIMAVSLPESYHNPPSFSFDLFFLHPRRLTISLSSLCPESDGLQKCFLKAPEGK